MKFLLFFIGSLCFAQQTKKVDFKYSNGTVSVNSIEKSVSGSVRYDFEVLVITDTIKIDAVNMAFSNLNLNGKKVSFQNKGNQLQLIFPFSKGKYQLSFDYKAFPKQTMYFIGTEVNQNVQIWTQGQGKNTSHWYPSFNDANEKIVFNLTVIFDQKYQVISNGLLIKSQLLGNENLKSWQYSMQKPMSSYLLMLAIGHWDKKTEASASKVPIELYYEPADQHKLGSTYRHSKKIFDFLEKSIGFDYPWKIYKQVPVHDFLYAGMENTTATLFNTRYVVDSIGFVDRSYTNVDAHELAHQWFGNLVTAKSGDHHWLQEGFATYYALLSEKEINGKDYFYLRMYETAQQLKFASRTDSIPVLSAKASSLTYYQKGAWALFVLQQKLGAEKFNLVIKNYLKKYAFKNVETADFLNEVKKVSDFDVETFQKTWLESPFFDTKVANEILFQNKMAKLQWEVDQNKTKSFADKKDFFYQIMISDAHYLVKSAVVKQLQTVTFQEKEALLHLALKTDNVQIRQEVAQNCTIIPESFREQFETLLEDQSYETKEMALYKLWDSFPARRSIYLEKSKDWIGFKDKNLRTLWLSLAISTDDFNVNKLDLIQELKQYSSANYEANTRQGALEKLVGFGFIDDTVLTHLVNATTHHMWQFSKYGRDTIRRLIKDTTVRESFNRILPTLNEAEKFQLNRLLIEK